MRYEHVDFEALPSTKLVSTGIEALTMMKMVVAKVGESLQRRTSKHHNHNAYKSAHSINFPINVFTVLLQAVLRLILPAQSTLPALRKQLVLILSPISHLHWGAIGCAQ